MKVSKRHSIRLSNGPLKGVKQTGSNMTEVQHGDLTVLYSYETPVAFLSSQGGYRTEKKWSVTTSKHIGKFFAAHGYDARGARKLPQEDIEAIVRIGAERKDFPINVDPTPKEMRDVVTSLLRRRGNPEDRSARFGRSLRRQSLDAEHWPIRIDVRMPDPLDAAGTLRTYSYFGWVTGDRKRVLEQKLRQARKTHPEAQSIEVLADDEALRS